MKFIAIVVVLTIPGLAFSQDLSERIKRLEDSNAAISSTLSRVQSDVADLKVGQKETNDKLDALARAVAPGGFQPSTQDAWGRGNPASFGTVVTVDQPMMYGSGYGSSMSSGRLFPRLRGILGGICGKRGGRGG